MRSRLAALTRLVTAVAAKGYRDDVLTRASALAFSTLISLVPLLAMISIFVARALREDDGRVLELLVRLLPYREESIDAALGSFLAQAESVSGVAVTGFVVTSLVTFFGVQESLYFVFGVAQPPSWWKRVVGFSLLFVWGPLLIGTAQAGLLVLGQANPELASALGESALLAVVPGAVTLVGLTMLFWRAAQGHVTLRDAAAGALFATVTLELLKVVFAWYVGALSEVQRAIYGGFAIAFFFVLSVQAAWTILLYGAELSMVLAARRTAAATPARPAVEPDPWVGLGALEALGGPGRPTLTTAELAPGLGRDAGELEVHLRPLVEAGLLETGDGYRLAVPAHRVRLAAVLAAFRHSLATARERHLPARTRDLRTRLRHAFEHDLGEETLADLLGQGPPAEGSAEGDDPAAALARDRAPG